MKQRLLLIHIITGWVILCSTMLSAQEIQIDEQMSVVGDGSPHTPDNYVFTGLIAGIPDQGQPPASVGGAASSGSQPDPDPDPDPEEDHCALAETLGDPLGMIHPTDATKFKRNPTSGRWGNIFKMSAWLSNVPHEYIETTSIYYTPGGLSHLGGQAATANLDRSPWAVYEVQTTAEDRGDELYQGEKFEWAAIWNVRCLDGSTKRIRHDGNTVDMKAEFTPWEFLGTDPPEGQGFHILENPEIDQAKTLCQPMTISTTRNYSVSFDSSSGLLSATILGRLLATFKASTSIAMGTQQTIPYGAGDVIVNEGYRDIYTVRDEYNWLGQWQEKNTESTREKRISLGWRPYVASVQPEHSCQADLVDYGSASTGL